MNGKDEIKSVRRLGAEFKAFISRGNVIDLAVGVIIGGAFGKIVSSLVNDILMPVIGSLMGGLNFSDLSVKIGDAAIGYGSFIQNIIDFLIIAASIFVFVKIISKLQSAAAAPKSEVEDKAVKKKQDEQLIVLKQIRDELKKKK
jgi:large conductance mechanosensitive channel